MDYIQFANNLLLFTVYAIVVALVINQALKSLENKVVIKLDSDSLNEQLDEQNLKDSIEVGFKFNPSYRLEDLKFLKFSLKNKLADHIISVDWDKSTIINFDNNAGRVIRVIDKTAEPPPAQTPSILLTGEGLDAELSNEKINDPLFDPKKLKQAAAEHGNFSLRLIFKISDPGTGSDRLHALRFKFIPSPLRWKRALTIALQPK